MDEIIGQLKIFVYHLPHMNLIEVVSRSEQCHVTVFRFVTSCSFVVE